MTESDKATRRINKGSDSAIMLREKYTRRMAALRRFTDHLQKGNFPDEAEMETLRAVGVSETEIKALVHQYAS
ncbi:MAG: hypothetical protein KDB82_17770 [Planctomycetes bacterium]|nr:hypothetical protein [Planctomycetota bacterium]